ncbi:glycosyltransferase [Roseomonas haemaphysalidis]|uniref:Glycosyltransferase family 2 protein n=1 Tax=Roseomonas haemaphysalidis TaxID=2768162 RepID=A0ABS3KQ19_9PROT|nr:glycosyltransferase family 2 protein [Roseomonas haemaphysalidis]MBO1079534.1 glycosyltransferase family 2 protein [Roseomonas haemaphysalidis]
MPPVLTVVIPCYNEAENVAPMVARLDVALAGTDWEAIFVDDDSPDGTAGIARAIAARDARIRCIRRIGRRGLASACIEGIMASSAPYVAVIDGDLQHDETILPQMLRALQAGEADVSIGSRHVDGGEAAEGFSPLRQRISEGGTALARTRLPVRVEDPMSGYFMLPRPVFEELAPRLTGRGFKILLDILLSAGRKLRVAEIPYVFRPRNAGESKLDTTVLLEFLALLLDKSVGGILPLRFLSFALVGGIGLLVHLATLGIAIRFMPFVAAQWTATFVAMTANFWLNNRITYRDVKLRGPALWRGLVLFYVVCGLGAVANVGVANLLLRDGMAAWRWAGAAGALLTGVWNYAVSATLVWRRR